MLLITINNFFKKYAATFSGLLLIATIILLFHERNEKNEVRP